MTDDTIQNPLEEMPEISESQEKPNASPEKKEEPQTQSSKKKKSFFSRPHKEEPIKDETTGETSENGDETVESSVVPEAGKVNELEQKLAESNDKFLRLFSDFDNFRKRTAREKIEMAKTASSDLILQLIPVIDDFERAIKAMENSGEATLPFRQGVELIYNKFWSILERQGVKPIEAIGQEFDTDYHEALTNIPASDETMKGKVIDQIEKGYILGDKVIRFAKVVVGI